MTPQEHVALLLSQVPPQVVVSPETRPGLSATYTIEVLAKAASSPEFVRLALAVAPSKQSRLRTPRILIEWEPVRADLIDSWIHDKAERAVLMLEREHRMRHARSGA